MSNQLIEGSSVQVPGKPYQMKYIGGVYSCSCPAWRNQRYPIDLRTCKHLCKYLGVESERTRVSNNNMPTKYKLAGVGPAPAAVATANPVPAVKKNYPCLLAETWKDTDPTGWWMSEKLDGVRAIWDGTNFRTRNNNILYAPDWFKRGMPKDRLDGELWLGHNMFQEAMSIVRRHTANGGWKKITYRVFAVPDAGTTFEDEIAFLNGLTLPAHIKVVIQSKCTGKHHLEQFLNIITQQDGEGVMLRKPGSKYIGRRSSILLKVKPWFDDEAKLVGYKPGLGKHDGVVGGLILELPTGKTFNVGSGLSNDDRENPPPVGASITYKYTGKTKDGIPKCASFVCWRNYE